MSRDSDWIFPVGILLLGQYGAALLVSRAVAFVERPPTASYMIMAMVLSVIGATGLLLRRLWQLWRTGEVHPAQRLRAEADWVMIGTYFLGFQLVALQIGALTWLKEMLPLAVPYWADPMLAALDRAVLGTDAWKLVPNLIVRPLDITYPFWAIVKFVVLLMVMIAPASRFKAQAMIAYFLTVGFVGVMGQYLLSSGGPIFYDRLVDANLFGDLTVRTREHAPIAFTASEYLWQSYLARDTSIGNGISAMPSMHVATTTWAAVALSKIWKPATIPIWAFWGLILAGSIALGWHYLSDGIVGAVGCILCWKLAPNVLRANAVVKEKFSTGLISARRNATESN